MKKIMQILVILLIPFSAYSLELSKENLQGEWLIVKVGDMDTKDMGVGEDIWEFKGDQWIVKSSGVSMRPESFSVKGQKIDFGSYSVEIIDFSESKMTANTLGIIQVLEKIK